MLNYRESINASVKRQHSYLWTMCGGVPQLHIQYVSQGVYHT